MLDDEEDDDIADLVVVLTLLFEELFPLFDEFELLELLRVAAPELLLVLFLDVLLTLRVELFEVVLPDLLAELPILLDELLVLLGRSYEFEDCVERDVLLTLRETLDEPEALERLDVADSTLLTADEFVLDELTTASRVVL